MTSIIIDSLDDKELNARLRLMLRNFRQNEGLRQDFSNRFPADFTYHSTAIEGSTLTLDEVKAAINGALLTDKTLLHCQMVSDHHEALSFVMDHLIPSTRLTVEFIKGVAAKVMRTTGAAHKTILGEYDESVGDLRLNNVHSDGQYFLNYSKVPGALLQFTNQIEQKLKEAKSYVDSTPTSLLKLAWSTHYELVKIHPFGDGNGRTARLIMNYILFRADLPPCVVFIEDRSDYISILKASHDHKEDNGQFSQFMLSQYFKTLSKTFGHG